MVTLGGRWHVGRAARGAVAGRLAGMDARTVDAHPSRHNGSPEACSAQPQARDQWPGAGAFCH